MRPLPLKLDDFDLTLVARIRVMIFLGRRFRRSPGYYRDAGLAMALLMGDRPRELWQRMVKEHVGISVRRAYQLIEIARGRSLDEFRASVSAKVRKHRKDKWLSAKAPRLKGAKTASSADSRAIQRSTHGQSTEVRLSRRRQPPTRRQDHARKP